MLSRYVCDAPWAMQLLMVLQFYVSKQEGVTVQIMCQLQYASDKVPFEKQHEHLQRGDIIGVVGFPGRTNPKKGGEGELSIFAREVILLTPCLRMLPTEHFGFKDQEQRHRQRFLDLIMNDRTRETFVTRTKSESVKLALGRLGTNMRHSCQVHPQGTRDQALVNANTHTF
jgi:lysyl-tRNA synthetase class II